MDESAEPIAALDGPCWRVQDAELRGRRIGRLPVECAVRPVAVVVVDEDGEHALEVAPVHDQEPVETLGPGRADEALGDRVRPRRPHRRLDDLDAFAGKDGVEVSRELAVAVADQEAKRPGRSRSAQVNCRAC